AVRRLLPERHGPAADGAGVRAGRVPAAGRGPEQRVVDKPGAGRGREVPAVGGAGGLDHCDRGAGGGGGRGLGVAAVARGRAAQLVLCSATLTDCAWTVSRAMTTEQ